MRWKNTQERYGYAAMLFHWLVGVLLVGMIVLGLYMTSLQYGDYRDDFYALHKSTGIIVFILVFARVLWRSISVIPDFPDKIRRIEIRRAQLTQKLLYIAMFVLPISGYINISAGNFELNIFGLFDVPRVVSENGFVEVLSLAVHMGGTYVLVALILLHIFAALKHHFLLKNNLLRRMLPIRLK